MIGPTTIGMYASSLVQAAPAAPSWSNVYALDFDGVDEVARTYNSGIETSYTKSGGRTLSFWFRPDALLGSGQQTLFRAETDSVSTYTGFWSFRIRYISAGVNRLSLQRRVENGSSFSPASTFDHGSNIAATTWQMATVTTDGSGHIIYLNTTGMSRDTVSSGDWWGDCAFIGNKGVAIAGRPIAFNVCFDGQIDEVTMWDKELSAAEVTALYNGGSPIDPTTHSAAANLSNYWRCGDGDTYPTIADNVGAYDLTMVNMESGDIQTSIVP